VKKIPVELTVVLEYEYEVAIDVDVVETEVLDVTVVDVVLYVITVLCSSTPRKFCAKSPVAPPGVLPVIVIR